MLGSAPIGNAKGPIRTRPQHDLIKKGESSEMNNSVAVADLNLSKRRVSLRLTTLAWAVLVFYLSTERFGSDFSQGLLAQALTLLHISVSPRTFHVLDTLLRKIAHLTEYGILAFFVYGSFAEHQPFRWRLRQAIWCIGIVGLYSLTDEFHQRFVPGRNASLVDCGIDIAGAVIALIIIFEARRLFRRASSD
jgi:VanZ family protein